MRAVSSRSSRKLLCALAVCVGSAPLPLQAITDNWTDGTGFWGTFSNWSANAVPANGDTVTITLTDGISRTITYNTSAVALASLAINLNGGIPSATTTLSMAGNSLTSNIEIVGYSGLFGTNGSGTFNQSGGNNTVTAGGSLYVGYNLTDRGFYNLSGTASLSVAGPEYIGVSGNGTFTHSSGTQALVSGSILYLGFAAGGNGTYSLSGTGLVSASGPEYIGNVGTGNFNQSGGTHIQNPGVDMYIGYGVGSIGTYTLSAGSLTANGTEYIGYSGTGNFNQSGGSHTQVGGNSMYIGYNAGFTSTYTLTGGTLTVPGSEYVSYNGTGNFNQSGGVHTVTSGSFLQIGYNFGVTGTYSLSGTGILSVSGTEYVGYFGTGNFTQSGGTNDVESGSTLTVGYWAGSTGTYTLLGGAVSTASGNEYVGQGGTGIFNQSGGSNTVGSGFNLSIANDSDSTGTYSLSGGSVNLSGGGSVLVGGISHLGNGVLNVSGTGVLTTPNLVVFNNPGSVINFSGGTINATALNVNGVPAHFNWTGGTLNITTSVTWDSAAAGTTTSAALGPAVVLAGTKALRVTGNETLGGSGSFSLQLDAGGSHFVSGSITLAPAGTITQNAGSTLFAVVFTQAGGTVNGTLQNQGSFVYQSGLFNGRLLNQGTVNLGPNFIAGNGVENDAAMTLSAGQVLTANGAGIDNLGALTITGGTLSGAGPVVNNFGGTMLAAGTINPAFTNNGRLSINGVLRFNNAAVNNGIIDGAGTIMGTFSNPGGGAIVVAAAKTLAFNSAWTNAGAVTLQGTGAVLGGGTISNTGTIQGAGTVSSLVNNTGTIESTGFNLAFGGGLTNAAAGTLAVDAGSKLFVSPGLATNAGIISLSGGTFDNNGVPLNNTGQITGYGTLRTGGLTNNGTFTLTGGLSTVNGNITNASTKAINIKYNPAIFTGDIINNGTIKTTNTTATFAGTYTGNAYISDPSTNIFQNNVTIIPGGSMTGGPGDQYVFMGGTVTNNGTFTNGGTLQSSDDITNNGTFTQSGPQIWSSGTTFTNAAGTATFSSDAGSPTSSTLAFGLSGGTFHPTVTQHLKSHTFKGGALSVHLTAPNTNSPILIIADPGALTFISGSIAVASNPVGPASLGYYKIIQHNGFTGPLNSLTMPAVANNVAYTLDASHDPGFIDIHRGFLGDANDNGTVEFNDFLLLSQNFGQPGGWSQGNFDGSSTVDFNDFLALSQHFGETIGGSSLTASAEELAAINQFAAANTPLPEPAALTLLALGALPLLLRRKR